MDGMAEFGCVKLLERAKRQKGQMLAVGELGN